MEAKLDILRRVTNVARYQLKDIQRRRSSLPVVYHDTLSSDESIILRPKNQLFLFVFLDILTISC